MAAPRVQRLVPTLVFALAGSFLAGCSGGSDPSVPSEIALAPGTVSFTAIGQTAQLSAAITDQRGDPVDATSVAWNSSNPGIATVSATGTVTAVGQGTTSVTAAVGGIAANASVTVAQTVQSFQVASGNGQSGGAGQPLAQPLAVRAIDPLGNAIQGLTVEFNVTQGGGSVAPATATTATDGRAVTTFTLGPDIDATNEVTATVSGTTFSVIFTATVGSAYDIVVRFINPPTAAQAQAFAVAEARWESLITGDLPNIQVNLTPATNPCNLPLTSELVDDLIIYVTLEEIDGPGNVLGAAGPCNVRDNQPFQQLDPGDLTVLGRMRFDTEDLEDLQQAGVLADVILHEMGHVLGIGTLWEDFGLLADPSLGTPAGVDPHFTGAGAIAGFNTAGGNDYTGGEKVPVEDEGGIGTADSHWRESVLGLELMTGFISANSNPLSAITVRSLDDIGYTVDVGGADPFTFDANLRAQAGRQWHLKGDILRGPIYGVNAWGTVVSVMRP